MFIVSKAFGFISRRPIKSLTAPSPDYQPVAIARFDRLARALRPADVLLVEGNTRIATAIKYLTQSTWSHSALYVGENSGWQEPSGKPLCWLSPRPPTALSPRRCRNAATPMSASATRSASARRAAPA